MTNAEHILSFLLNIAAPAGVPEGIEVMNPFSDENTQRVASAFYTRYYSDEIPRYCIIGINPGRFGAGVTGVPFTDPIRLEKSLGITNPWPKKIELSSVFIYDMIEAFGGAERFYNTFYITAVSPLGFTRANKNLNYYDNKLLAQSITPFAVACLQQQLSWSLKTDVAFCLGEGENFRFLQKLNAKHGFFSRIIPLAHPRFIMQYRLKKKEEYILKYLEAFNAGIDES